MIKLNKMPRHHVERTATATVTTSLWTMCTRKKFLSGC